MKAKKIVFPTDFSHCSEEALHYATVLARESEATLWIVHAEEPPVPLGGSEMYRDLLESDYEEMRRTLCAVVPADKNVVFEHRMLRGPGNPANKIVDFAKEIDADMIVMGTHGRSGVKRLLMGSVAEGVLRHAPCPVLMMKQGVGKPANVA